MSDEQNTNQTQSENTADELTKVIKERDEFKNNWHRALADYQNLQKETAARRAELFSMSEQQILEEFIPVYDNFKKAFAFHPEVTGENSKQIQNWINGIGHIMRQFQEILKAHNVVEIKTIGEKFNPSEHEAVGEEEGEKGAGVILKEVDGGYKMGGRVIRVAKVIVNK